jgi:hypothetical protein
VRCGKTRQHGEDAAHEVKAPWEDAPREDEARRRKMRPVEGKPRHIAGRRVSALTAW